MAKAPKPGVRRKSDEIDAVEAWTVTIGVYSEGDELTKHSLRLPDLTARDVLALRTLTPFKSWQEMVAPLVRGDVDPVAAAALIWLSRRRDGEPDLDFGDVLDDVSLDSLNALSTHKADDTPAEDGADTAEGEKAPEA